MHNSQTIHIASPAQESSDALASSAFSHSSEIRHNVLSVFGHPVSLLNTGIERQTKVPFKSLSKQHLSLDTKEIVHPSKRKIGDKLIADAVKRLWTPCVFFLSRVQFSC